MSEEQHVEKDALSKAWDDYCTKCFKVGQLNEWMKDLKRQYDFAEEAVHQSAIKHDNLRKQLASKTQADATPLAKDAP